MFQLSFGGGLVFWFFWWWWWGSSLLSSFSFPAIGFLCVGPCIIHTLFLSPLQTDKSMLHSTSMATVAFTLSLPSHIHSLLLALIPPNCNIHFSLFIALLSQCLCQASSALPGQTVEKWRQEVRQRYTGNTHRSWGRVSPTPLVPSMLWSLPRGRSVFIFHGQTFLYVLYQYVFWYNGICNPSFLFHTFFWQAADLTLKHSAWHDSSVS